MDTVVIETARRRLRDRRARRLLDQARSQSPGDLEGIVPTLEALVAADDADARFRAVGALSALARSQQSHPVRERATDALVGILEDGAPAVQVTVSPELRHAALDRPELVSRLDDPYAGILASESHRARRRVAVDAGILLAEHGTDVDAPDTRKVLRELLVGGDREDRRTASTAYVLLAGSPSLLEEPGTVAEHLAILEGELDGPLIPADSHLRRLADDRSLGEAIDAYAELEDNP